MQDAAGQGLALSGAVCDHRGVQRGTEEGPLHGLGHFPHIRALAHLDEKRVRRHGLAGEGGQRFAVDVDRVHADRRDVRQHADHLHPVAAHLAARLVPQLQPHLRQSIGAGEAGQPKAKLALCGRRSILRAGFLSQPAEGGGQAVAAAARPARPDRFRKPVRSFVGIGYQERGDDGDVVPLLQRLPDRGVVREPRRPLTEGVDPPGLGHEAGVHARQRQRVPRSGRAGAGLAHVQRAVDDAPHGRNICMGKVLHPGQLPFQIGHPVEEAEQAEGCADVEAGAAPGVRRDDALRSLDDHGHQHHRGDDHGEHDHGQARAEATGEGIGDGGLEHGRQRADAAQQPAHRLQHDVGAEHDDQDPAQDQRRPLDRQGEDCPAGIPLQQVEAPARQQGRPGQPPDEHQAQADG